MQSKTHPNCHSFKATQTQGGHRVLPAAQLGMSDFKKRRDCEGENPRRAQGPQAGALSIKQSRPGTQGHFTSDGQSSLRWPCPPCSPSQLCTRGPAAAAHEFTERLKEKAP